MDVVKWIKLRFHYSFTNKDKISLYSISQDAVILDARTDMEYRSGHLDSVMHIPLDEIRDRMQELPRDKKIYVYCQSGLRSYLACRILKQNGFSCCNISGGYGFYENLRYGSIPDPEGKRPCGMK